MPIAAVAAGFVVAALSAVAIRAPLGHDESVYMLRARDIGSLGWSSTSGGYWVDYRAPGVPVLLALLEPVLGLHVSTSRAVVVALGLALVVCTWELARRLAGDVAAIIAAITLVSTAGYLLTSSVLLADVPGAAFTLPAVVVFLVEARRGRLMWAFLVVPALAFVGTTSRFGSPFMLGAGLIGVSVVVVPDVVRQRNWMLVAQTAVLAVAVALCCGLVLLTDLVSLKGDTPAHANQQLVDGKGLTFSTGVRDLASVVNPWSDGPLHLWSAPVAVLAAVGLILAVGRVVSGRFPAMPVVGMAVAALTSLGGIVASVGLIVPNYLALTLPYWAVLIGIGLEWPVRAVFERAAGSPVRSWAMIGTSVVVAFILQLDASSDARATHHGYVVSFGAIRAASTSVATEWSGDCVLVTSYTPQVGYYSGCAVTTFGSGGSDVSLADTLPRRVAPLVDGDAAPPAAVGVLVVESGKRQPPQPEFDQSPALDRERLFETGAPGDRRGHVWVQLVDVCVFDASC